MKACPEQARMSGVAKDPHNARAQSPIENMLHAKIDPAGSSGPSHFLSCKAGRIGELRPRTLMTLSSGSFAPIPLVQPCSGQEVKGGACSVRSQSLSENRTLVHKAGSINLRTFPYAPHGLDLHPHQSSPAHDIVYRFDQRPADAFVGASDEAKSKVLYCEVQPRQAGIL